MNLIKKVFSQEKLQRNIPAQVEKFKNVLNKKYTESA